MSKDRGMSWSGAALMVAVAFTLRLSLLLSLGIYDYLSEGDYWYFGYEIGRVASSIAEGKGFSFPFDGSAEPTAGLAPIYPYLLAGVFKLFGIYSRNSAIGILALNSLFSALTCLVILRVGAKVFSPSVGRWSAWVWVVLPSAVIHSLYVWETTLSTLLLSLLVLLTLKLEASNDGREWVLAGLLWGVAGLTRPTLLSPFPLFIFWLFLRRRKEGLPLVRPFGQAVLALVLVLSSWMVRNYKVFGEIVPIKSNLGYMLLVGSYEEQSTHGSPIIPRDFNSVWREIREQGELRFNEEKRRQAFQLIAANPFSFLRLTVVRFLRFWGAVPGIPGRQTSLEINVRVVFSALFSGLAALGFYLMLRQRPPGGFLLCAVLAAYPLVYYVTTVLGAYRHPVEPVMVLLAVYSVSETIAVFQRQAPGRSAHLSASRG